MFSNINFQMSTFFHNSVLTKSTLELKKKKKSETLKMKKDIIDIENNNFITFKQSKI